MGEKIGSRTVGALAGEGWPRERVETRRGDAGTVRWVGAALEDGDGGDAADAREGGWVGVESSATRPG